MTVSPLLEMALVEQMSIHFEHPVLRERLWAQIDSL